MSRDFYPREFTDRARSVLAEIHQAVPDAVLIGGWGTWVRTGGPQSHDIDLIVTRPQLAVLTTLADEMSESRHLGGRKWGGTLRGIHLDLYVPYESRLGQHLQLRTERLLDRRDQVNGWTVLDLAGHLATKLAALIDRPDTLPGDKDRSETMALLELGVTPTDAVAVLHHSSTRSPAEVTELIVSAFGYLAELHLERTPRQRLRQLGAQWATASRQIAAESPPQADLPSRGSPPRRGRDPSLGR